MIISCQKYKHKLEKYYKYEEENKDTLAWCQIKFVYIMGGPPDPELPKVTFLDIPDTYEDLPKKVIEGVKYIYQNLPDVHGIFRMDDDVEINYHSMRFIHFLYWIPFWGVKVSHIMYDNTVWQVYERFSRNDLPVIPLDKCIHPMGFAYYINRHCIEIIMKNVHRFYHGYHEDAIMGRVLNEAHMYPVDLNHLLSEHFVVTD